MRIYKDRFYILRNEKQCNITTGQWSTTPTEIVVTGHIACNRKGAVDSIREFKPTGKGLFRVEDGHLPDYQPRLNETDMLEWLRVNWNQGAIQVS